MGAAAKRIAGVLAGRGIDVSGQTILRWVQKFGPALAEEVRRHRKPAGKVHIARRVAWQANPSIRCDAIVGDVLDEQTAIQLRDVDFLFLATDSIRSRLVFNALVHQYFVTPALINIGLGQPAMDGGLRQVQIAADFAD